MVKFCTIVPHAKRKLHGETNITALFLPLIYCFSNKRAVGFTFPWIDIINKSVITLFFLLDTRWPFLEIPKETLKTQKNHKMLQECFWSVGKHQNQISSISSISSIGFWVVNFRIIHKKLYYFIFSSLVLLIVELSMNNSLKMF